ncbi:uncharacterized protein B0H18DRAFT_1083995 [Fomitopsis serialis]|uniref:uncharacterized protein n=1 Tax=Fomitopsis serialis TaxID=139415 RepID=UPI0020072DC7|nr:uncharacterized protein B0H18DRAFT_1083995 [Neoantrodia serialis]KAH9930092.1 hypothetical protein B0H18DRAFT_1083995 [Neoantrodia serialis]
MPEVLPIYLPPPGPPRPRPLLTSTQDLVKRFQLLPAYDKYVRPYAPAVGQPSVAADKGKGKEKEMSVPLGATPGAVPDGEEDDGDGKKKAKNTYKQLIKGIPGKHSMKKDDYLTTMMQVPPKQRISILPFDQRTQRDAFSVSLEGLKGWNINALVAESPQAREDRKKRKELKKLAKIQGQTPLVAGTPSVFGLPATPAAVSSSATASARGATPKLAGVQRPAASIPHANVNPSHPRGRTPVGIGTPQSMPTPGTAAIPTPAPTSAAFSPSVATPATASVPTVAEPKRGTKREREPTGDGSQAVAHTNGVGTTKGNGNGTATSKPAMVVSAKAGNAGVRPRPLKKQRMDTEGAARPLPIQQPTPHA